MKLIYIIDDDQAFLTLTGKYLKKHHFNVKTFLNWNDTRDALSMQLPELILVDLNLPDFFGIDIVKTIKKEWKQLPVLMITAHSSIETAIEAVKAGAEDYIQKPCENSEILFKIQRVFDQKKKDDTISQLKETLDRQYRFQNLVTKDPDLQKTYELAKAASDIDVTVFIGGDTGTGKEMLARAIHMEGKRKNLPFVIVNCAAINENLIESELFGHKKGAFTSAFMEKEGKCHMVKGGTLFLDEIGELSLNMQKKLLRLLQEREYEKMGSNKTEIFQGRVIAASHRHLKIMVENGQFREDLFFRLNVFPVILKSLKDRPSDIVDLANLFLTRFCEKYKKAPCRFSEKALSQMLEYSWPGNVRELINFVERQVVISPHQLIDFDNIAGVITDAHESQPENSSETVSGKSYPEFIKEREREYFMKLLKDSGGNIEEASQIAGIHRKTLYVKLKELNIDKNDFKPARP